MRLGAPSLGCASEVTFEFQTSVCLCDDATGTNYTTWTNGLASFFSKPLAQYICATPEPVAEQLGFLQVVGADAATACAKRAHATNGKTLLL